MTNDETTRLARSMQKIDDGSLNLYEHKVNLLCDHILSGHMRREIENAAYRRCIEIGDKAILDGNSSAIRMNRVTVDQIKNDIRALIKPPA